MYTIRFANDAIDDLRRLDKATAARIIRKINWLAENADNVVPKGLRKEFAGLAKIREGDYRIIYQLLQNEEVLVVHVVGHRRDVYDR